MISIIAASMLAATVVFTGCGGGGSSSSATPVVSSSSSEATSSTPQITPKTVSVSDWWVNGATVSCGGNSAVATTTGHYEFDVESCPANMVSTGGYSDTNRDGMISSGDLGAPNMEAPANYNNINAFTTFIAEGVEPANLANALGLPADTNFDVAVPEASDQLQRIAPVVTAFLAQLQSGAITKSLLPVPSDAGEEKVKITEESTCLPGQPCESGDETATSSAAPSVALTMADVVAGFNAGKTLSDFLPQDLMTLKGTLESAEAGENYELLAASVVKKYTGVYEEEETVSSEATSSESTVGSGLLPVPGDTPVGNPEASAPEESTASEATSSSEESTSSEATSSSEESTSSEATSSSEASSEECEVVPGSDNTCEASSSSVSEEDTALPPEGEENSSEATSSSEESTSSEAASSSEAAGEESTALPPV